jgi:ABC-2 type transport system ATP-binding protein
LEPTTPAPLPVDGVAPEIALAVLGLSKEYENHRAVDDLSFRVTAGEILGLVGPNGAGKTTTLRSIVGVLPIKTGRVVVRGHDLATDEVLAKAQLAWIPDDPQPFDTLTVEEHLRFSAALYGIRDWRARATELLSRFELAEKKDALGGELSRGMRQKLAFCTAWIHEPRLVLNRILFLDRGRKKFEGTLREARAALALGDDHGLEDIFMSVTEPTSGSAGTGSN